MTKKEQDEFFKALGPKLEEIHKIQAAYKEPALKSPVSKRASHLLHYALTGAIVQFKTFGRLTAAVIRDTLEAGEAHPYQVTVLTGYSAETQDQVRSYVLKEAAKSVPIVVVTESWLQVIDKRKNPALFEAVVNGGKDAVTLPPSADLNRQEALTAYLRDEGGRTVVFHAPITREGKAAKLGEFRTFSDGPDPEFKSFTAGMSR